MNSNSQIDIVKSIAVVMVLIVSSIVYSAIFNNPETATASLSPSSGWQYYKQIDISNAVTNYQIRIHLVNSTGTDSGNTIYVGGKSENFPFDIRFGTTSNPSTADTLPQWLEEYNDTDAYYWVNISSYSTIYMFTGNSGAGEYSDGDATFLFFDDFEGSAGASPNSSKWTIEKKGSTDAVVELDGNGNLHLAGESSVISSGNVKSLSTFTYDFSIILRHKIDEEHYADTSIGSGSVQDISGGTSGWHHTVLGDGYIFKWQSPVGGGSSKDISINKCPSGSSSTVLTSYDGGGLTTLNEWHKLTMIYDSSGNLKWYHDGTLWLEATDTTYLNNAKYLLLSQGEYSGGEGGNRYIDYVFVRKYADPEPTISTGSWQAIGEWVNTPPAFSSENPTNGSTGVQLQPTVSVYVGDADGNYSTVDFYISTDGTTWTHVQQNTSVLNETVYCHYTSANQYATTYYWKVTANDGHDNVSAIYHFTTVTESTPPEIISVSQTYDNVDVLGDHIFDSVKGHNFLHGEFSDNAGLDYVYVECSIDNGTTWHAMKKYWIDDFLNLTLVNEITPPLRVREKVSVQQYPDKWYMFYGDNVATSNQAFHRMESTDKENYTNDIICLNETDHDQDINVIVINGTLYAFEEDGDLNDIAIHISTDRGQTFTALKKHWNPDGIKPQSPNPYVWNGNLYVIGESWAHNGDWGYIIKFNGSEPIVDAGGNVTNYAGYDWIGDVSSYDALTHHFAVKSIYILKNNTAILGITGTNASGWNTWLVYTNNTNPYPDEPYYGWKTPNINGNLMSIEKTFNGFYIISSLTQAGKIWIYRVDGGEIEKHYFGGATSGNWTYEFYEPTLPNGTKVMWRFVVVDTSGNVNYSESMSFTIGASEINISLSPTTWSISGNPQTGTSINTTADYFTIWNNGSVDATVKIAINNSADWTYCDWNTYKTTSNLNYFTCNYTTDGTTWTNIEPKSGNEPVTVIFSNLKAGTSDTFGIKLWIPRYLSNTNTQQFEVYIKAYV